MNSIVVGSRVTVFFGPDTETPNEEYQFVVKKDCGQDADWDRKLRVKWTGGSNDYVYLFGNRWYTSYDTASFRPGDEFEIREVK